MREILFRGKRVDNGEWETGGIIMRRQRTSEETTYIADIMTGYPTPVDSKTVGQYTGLTDKNGTKIFEGDIIRDVSTGYVYEIKYERLGFLRADKKRFYYWTFSESDYEVIGNIFDNPELMKDGTQI